MQDVVQDEARDETVPAGTWAPTIAAVTLFQEDLAAAKDFYRRVFGLPVQYEDESSAVFLFGPTMVNLLAVSAAPELVEPATVADPAAGNRAVMTVGVEDVDTLCATVVGRGARLVNGPMDRPWGIRTASFRDPGGHLWEFAQPLSGG